MACSNPRIHGDPLDLNDEALLKYSAMYQVDREEFCLTDIDRELKAEIREADTSSRGYDVALQMHGNGISRAVFFIRDNDDYAWIGEQEIHRSGKKYRSLDGELPEQIVITYRKKRTEAGPKGLMILYFGDDEKIPSAPTCSQAISVIEAWAAER